MARRWYNCAAAPAGPPARVVLPVGKCRRWWPVGQSITGLSVVQLPVGMDSTAPGVIVQTFGPNDLAALATEGLPLADDRVAIDVSIQGPPGSSVATIIDDGCC